MRRQWSGKARTGAAAIGGVIAVALVSPTTPVTAAPLPETPTASPRSETVVTRHTVTLLTGDVVLLEKTADGRQLASVRPPTDRQQISYQTRQIDGHAYVIPSDAIPLLADGTLDERLFDITQLVEYGYDDSRHASTPLIVQYAPSLSARARTADLPGTTRTFTLESVNATAVQGKKAEAKSLWTALTGTPTGPAEDGAGAASRAPANAATGAIERIWLDGQAKVSLAESVPQIGAPEAWAGGHDGTGVTVAVLDTGIDTTHPDLAGKVVAAQNFSADSDTVDHHGHGTHVASTVAGTGAASGGTRKGVAPGAKLISAKVLDTAGNGFDSGIIEGMEWAAAQGAKVLNMSLGTNAPSDGNDPLTQAVDAISRSTGALFVIAAGNIGPGESTIGSPGWADEALTVGAVNKEDGLASFSSRGPRLGDYGIKPDVTAPGVGIVAARASGTAMGTVIDDQHTQANGTSMASPHVAGAAAILAQQHPDYTNRQLKDLLISTAKAQDDTVHRQGSGRVDLARAHRQPVYASPGTLNLGYFTYPHSDHQPVTRTVTYHNDGATELTFTLSLSVQGKKGTPAPDGLFTVSQPTVTVPAGGTASVDVTVAPARGTVDLYGGHLVAAAGDTVVRTSVGAYLEEELYTITAPAIAHDGRQADGISQVELWSPTRGFETKYYQGGTVPTFRVPVGTYSLMGYIFTMDAPNRVSLGLSVVGDPQLEVTGDTTVTLDARKAKEITVKTPKPTSANGLRLSYYRQIGEVYFDSSFLLSEPFGEAYAAPTEAVTEGMFEFASKWSLIAPPITMSVVAPERIPLDPLFMIASPRVDGRHRVPVVHAGFGSPDEYTGLDVRGKLALVQRGNGISFVDKVRNAANAGAAAVIVFNNVPGLLYASAGEPGQVAIPAFTLDEEPGLDLVERLAAGPVTIEYSGTALSDYVYDLMLPNKQRIASNQTYVINERNTARIDAEYRANGDPVLGADLQHALRPYNNFLMGFIRALPRPLKRTEWVSADPDIRWQHQAWASSPFDGEFTSIPTSYRPGSRSSQTWFGQVLRPGFPAGLTGWENFGTPAYREGDTFNIRVFPYVDSAQHYASAWAGDTVSTKLYRGDELVAESSSYPAGTFPAAPGSATYRLTLEQQRSAAWWQYSTNINTTWTFRSATPASGRQLLPLLQADHHVDLDRRNRTAKRQHNFTLTVGHQPGVDGPKIKTVQGWASFDDGATWQAVDLVQLGNGKHLAKLRHPAPENVEAVSLRIKASDTAGNGIDQTIIRAYGL
ncbi:S8 family serine peptidase [Micromonospora sp. NBC_01655]|uniref:S8 family serine peptidase n=1 Tax=Micromonospora sp. NBC_01655 TaxID=2975983 RepID=UPI002253749A|nr:S8 family serine peptidase [Micromonospora sp. NBC_01655]MCX4471429.1 S8 family serine peptidase [Micromonospora sp. NBC_01655]